jgi:hypothetical protein
MGQAVIGDMNDARGMALAREAVFRCAGWEMAARGG